MARSDREKVELTGDEAILEEAREAYELACEVENENRLDAMDDIKFARLGEQWPEKVKRDRELDGRPCLTINRLPAFIRQVVNDARQNKPAIAVHPVDSGSDPETAEIFSGLIRNIEQSSDAEVAYDTALDFAVTGGFGYFRINTRYTSDDSFEQDLVIERVSNPFSVYGDPNSMSADSADWNCAFVVESMPKAQFEKRWKGAEAVDWQVSGYASLQGPWMDGDRVLVAEYWKREEVPRKIVALSDGQVVGLDVYTAQKANFDALGVTIVGKPREITSKKVTQYIMTGAELLETVEWAGKYIPIVPVYGEELVVDGKRHLRSLVRDAKDPQRMFNYWRTTSTELVALAPKAPFIGKKGAFETDSAKWATANVQTHAYIEYDGAEAPQRQPFSGVPAGAIQESLNAADDMKSIMGLHDASLGARSNETSGRAIMARQREGDVSTFHYIDNLSRSIRHAGRILIDLIPKVYSTARMVRVLGPDGKPHQVPLKKPVTIDKKDENGQVEQITRTFDLAVGKYDVTVSAGPSFTSRREEAATQMIELIRAYPPAAPVIGDLLARNLDWPGADEVATRLRALVPPEARGDGAAPNPEVEQAKVVVQQLQAQGAQMAEELKAAQAELKAKEADHALAMRKLDIEAQAKAASAANDAKKLAIEAFNAETTRMRALAPKGVALDPNAVAPVADRSLDQIANSPDILPPAAGELGDEEEGQAREMAEGSNEMAEEGEEPAEPNEISDAMPPAASDLEDA